MYTTEDVKYYPVNCYHRPQKMVSVNEESAEGSDLKSDSNKSDTGQEVMNGDDGQGVQHCGDSADVGRDATIPRRPVLKAAGVGLLGSSLAGCMGGGQSTTTTTTDSGGGSPDLQNVKFKYVDRSYYQASRVATKTVESLVKRFEAKTGATINLNMIGDTPPINEMFQSGNHPHLMTASVKDIGAWIGPGFIKPFKDYQDKFPDYLSDVHPTVKSAAKFSWSQWPEDHYMMTLTANPYAPFIARMDHFREAGLDPKKDFPPKNYDDLVRIAKKLQKDGPSNVGYQTYGCNTDIHDVHFNQWSAAADKIAGGKGGYTFGDDWGTVNFDNETWKKVMGQNVGLFTNHNIGSPKTPTMCDEPTISALLAGSVSMCQQSSENMPTFYNRGKNLFKNGDLKWGIPWSGRNNIRANMFVSGTSVQNKPEGKDQATWDKSLEGVYAFKKFIKDTNVLTDDFPSMGFPPALKSKLDNVVENDRTTSGGWLSVVKKALNQSDTAYAYEAHPLLNELNFEVLPPHVQAAFKGEKSVDKAMDDAAAEAQKLVDESRFAN